MSIAGVSANKSSRVISHYQKGNIDESKLQSLATSAVLAFAVLIGANGVTNAQGRRGRGQEAQPGKCRNNKDQDQRKAEQEARRNANSQQQRSGKRSRPRQQRRRSSSSARHNARRNSNSTKPARRATATSGNKTNSAFSRISSNSNSAGNRTNSAWSRSRNGTQPLGQNKQRVATEPGTAAS